MDLSTIALGGLALLVALIISSRNIGSFWTLVYRLLIGGVAAGVCLFVLQKVDTGDEVKWLSSFVIGTLLSLLAPGIPWREIPPAHLFRPSLARKHAPSRPRPVSAAPQ